MLSIWMPCTKDIRNQGLVYSQPTGNYEVVNDNQRGKVVHTTSATAIDTLIKSTEGWDMSTGSCGFGAWLKFNLNEMKFASAYTYTSSVSGIRNVVLGYNSYGGFSFDFSSNNIYTSGEFTSASIQPHFRFGGVYVQTTGKNVVFDEWHHWYLQYVKERNSIEFYYDGVFFSSASTTSVTISTLAKNFKVNDNTVWGGNGAGKYLPYYVSDVRVYNHRLSADEIKEIYKRKLLDIRGDSIVNSRSSLSDIGGTGIVIEETGVTKSGSTLYFNGTSSIMKLNDLDFMTIIDNAYTFSLWIYSQEADSSRSIYFGCGNQGNGWTFALEKQANTNKLRVYNNGAPDWYVDNCVITPNQWIHVAVTRNNGTVTVYKNGVSVGTKTGFTNHTGFDKTYYIGSDYRTGDTRFKGYIGDFKIYASPLTATEVSDLYNKEKSKY